MENTLSNSFSESIRNNTGDAIIDSAELLVDSFLDEGVLKDIPVVKYVVTAYHVIDDLRGKAYLRKLIQFINTFNAGVCCEADIAKYRERVAGGKASQELEYVLCVIDKYLDLEKPSMLAKLYLSYLDKLITWDEFCAYSEVLDHIFRNDIHILKTEPIIKVYNNQVSAELLRLTGAGLLMDYQNNLAFTDDGGGGIEINENAFERIKMKERVYTRTDFGEKLVMVLGR